MEDIEGVSNRELKSLRDVIEDLDLTPADPEDAESVKAELKRIIRELHPDTNGGQFRSEQDKERFLRATEAFGLVERLRDQSKAMVPISELSLAIERLSRALQNQQGTSSTLMEQRLASDLHSRTSRRYAPWKVSSATVGAIAGGLFTFSESLQSHPVLRVVSDSLYVQIGLLALALYAFAFFCILWINERRDESRVRFLMSETALPMIYGHLNPTEGQNISADDVRAVIQGLWKHRVAPAPLVWSPELSLIEQIAEVQIRRMVERKLLVPLDVPSPVPLYRQEVGQDAAR